MSFEIDRNKNEIEQLAAALDEADAVIVGAGAGLSTSAGFRYDGERFNKYLWDFAEKYRFSDMYTGGFVMMQYKDTVNWAYWSRNIYINRYMDPPKDTYRKLLNVLYGKDYFVITTNVDHLFQKAGIDKNRLFYTQGDYGLWQCRGGRIKETYDNEVQVKKMLLAQGFWFEHVKSKKGVTVEKDSELIRQYGEYNAWQCDELDFEADWGALMPPADEEGRTDYSRLTMEIPKALLPKIPGDGSPAAMNLRADDTFVEDFGWRAADRRYADFLNAHQNGKVLFLDLGSGYNTPVIFKIPFMRWTMEWPSAIYATINKGQAVTAPEIREKSIVIDDDIDAVLDKLTAPSVFGTYRGRAQNKNGTDDSAYRQRFFQQKCRQQDGFDRIDISEDGYGLCLEQP